MRRFKKLFVALLVVATVLGTVTTFASAGPLADIEGTKYEAAVKALTGLNIVTGFPDGTYKPNATLTRAMAAAIMVRALGLEETAKLSKGATPFSDVPATDWASGYVNVAFAQGVINGIGNNQFAPLREVTYAELATMLVRAAGLAKEAVGPWPTNFITVATKYGLTAGTDFSASKPATRGDTALMAKVAVFDTKSPDTNKTIAQSVFNVGPKLASVLLTGDATTVGVGGKVQFTAKALDDQGNEIKDAAFTFTVDKGGSVGNTGLFVASDAGVATVTATTGTGDAAKSATATVTVYGVGSAIKTTNPAAFTADAKATTTLTAQVVDATGNIVANSTAAIRFAVLNGNVKIQDGTSKVTTKTVNAVNGVASVTLVGADTVFTAGDSLIAVSSNGLTGALATASLKAPTLTSFKLSVAQGTIESKTTGSNTTVTVSAADENGNAMPAGKAVVVTLTSSDKNVASFGGNATTTVSFASTDQTKTATISATNVWGDVSLTGSSDASVPVTGTSLSTRVAGDAYKLVLLEPVAAINANGNFSVKVGVQDFAGTLKTTDTTTTAQLTAKDADGNDVIVGSGPITSLAAVNGVITFAVNVQKAGAVNFEITSGTLVKVNTSSTVNPGTVAHLDGITASPATIASNGVATSTISVNLVDDWGNTVPSATNAVTFSKTVGGDNAATTAPATLTVNPVNGTASIVVTSTTKEATDTYTAAAKDANGIALAWYGGTTSANVASVILGYPYKLALSTPAANPKAGASFTVKAMVQDFNTNTVSTDNSTTVTLKVTDPNGAATTYTATDVAGVASFSLNYTLAGTYSLEATSGSLTKGTNSVIVAPAGAAKVTLKASPTSIETNTAPAVSSASTITASAADQYGNTITTATIGNLLMQKNSSAAAGFDAGTGVLTASTTAETVTIGDSDGVATVDLVDGIPVTPVSVAIYTAGPADHIAIDAIKDTVAAGTMTVKVKYYDSNGNFKTGFNSAVGTSVLTITTAGTDYAVAGDGQVINGVATFTVTSAGLNKAMTLSFLAHDATTWGGVATKDVTASGKFVNDVANKVTVDTTNPATIEANGSSIAVLTARVTDQWGNTVPTATGTMIFNISTGNDYATLLNTSAAILGGVATVQVQAKTKAGTAAVTAKVDGSTLTTGNGTVQVVAGAPASISVAIVGTNPIVTGSGTVTIYATVYDANNNAVTSGITVDFTMGGTGSGTIAPASDATGADGYTTIYTAPAGPAVTGSNDVTATVNGTSISGTVTVNYNIP